MIKVVNDYLIRQWIATLFIFRQSMSETWLEDEMAPSSRVSQEPSLGFEPTPLPLSESAVQHSTLRATRVLWRWGRHSLSQRLPLYFPCFFLSGPCQDWPSIAACLDPWLYPALTLTPIPVLGPPWPSIMVHLGSQLWSALAHDFGQP